MKRRDFLKMGILSMSSICFLPGMLSTINNCRRLDADSYCDHEYSLSGIFHEEIQNGTVKLPSSFLQHPTLKHSLLYASDTGFVKFIPKDDLLSDTAFASSEYEMTFSFIGKTMISENGFVYIPRKARKIASLSSTGSVVILGMINTIEIWDKKRWDDMTQDLINNPAFITDLMQSLSKVI